MPGYLESYKAYEEETTPGTGIDYLKGNLFQKITLDVIVRFQTWFNCSVAETAEFADITMLTDDWLFDSSGRFRDFSVGDELKITSATNPLNNSNQSSSGGRLGLLISEKLNDFQVRCTDELGVSTTFIPDPADASAVFSLVQNPTGISFDYGLPTNNGATAFTSPIDGELMRFEYGENSSPWSTIPSVKEMIPQGLKSWHIGSCKVIYLGITGGETEAYRYRIIQEFFIIPFYLAPQIFDWTSFPNVLAPNYFAKTQCLKQVFRIRGLRDLADPNVYQELVFDKKDGNTGWKDEKYNGGVPDFTASGATYGNAATVNSLTRDDVVSVSFTIDKINTPYPKYIGLNFIMHPEDASDYQNINSTVIENYAWDRCFITEGSGPTTGENNGTAYQVLTNVTNTATATSVTISFDVDFGTGSKAKIDSLSQKNYSIWAYAGSELRTAETANYTTFLIDYGEIKVSIPDTTAVTTSDILFHDQNDATIVSSSPVIKVEDEITVDSKVMLAQTTQLSDVQLDSVNLELVAINSSTNEELVLQSESIDLSNEPLIGAVRFINRTTPTNFQVNPLEIRANNKSFRDPSLDTVIGGVPNFAYKFQHTFLFRWAYWEQLLINSFPVSFQDTTANFNGYNNDWTRLATFTDWAINYRVQTNLISGVTKHQINNDTVLINKDYDSNALWTTALTTFDDTTPLVYSSNPYILTNKKTTVKAAFTYTGGTAPNAADVYMVARIIPKENGDFENNFSFSSVWDRQSVSVFENANPVGLIGITKVGSVFTGEFDIDDSKLPFGVLEYTISVSINLDTQVAATSDYGQIFKTNVLALEDIVIPPTIDIPENPFKVCCLPLKVFASLTSTNTFINDFTGFIELFPVQFSVTMNLEKYNEITKVWDIVLSNIANDLSAVSRNNRNYFGSKINWKPILTSFGVGKYRMDWDYSSGNRYSMEYCLEEYSQTRADETVRFEYKLNSVIGSKTQTEVTDYVGLNWLGQIRLDNAIFNNRSAPYEVEGVRMSNGRERTISKSFRETYSLELRRSQREVFDLLMYTVLMADDLKVCDYNSSNNDDFVNTLVEVNGEFAPDNSNSRPYPSGSIEFISRYSNNKKFYS